MVFRTVASPRVGFGHLRRCLTLADELARRGLVPQLWIEGADEARAMAAAAGFVVQAIDGDEPGATRRMVGAGKVAGLIVDSYALDVAYFRALRPQVSCLMAIDDLADRELDVDLISNGSANATELGYRTGEGCLLLLGPQYALLRPQFRDLPPHRPSPTVKRVLVTLGGGDPDQATVKVVEELMVSLPRSIFEVVVGPLFGAGVVAALQEQQRGTDRVVLHHAPTDLSALMTACDLAVSGGGQTVYELAACGLPTVALCLADNQRGQLSALARRGTLLLGGERDEDGRFPNAGAVVVQLAADRALRERISATGQRLVDGGGTVRVADALVKKLGSGDRREAR